MKSACVGVLSIIKRMLFRKTWILEKHENAIKILILYETLWLAYQIKRCHNPKDCNIWVLITFSRNIYSNKNCGIWGLNGCDHEGLRVPACDIWKKMAEISTRLHVVTL